MNSTYNVATTPVATTPVATTQPPNNNLKNILLICGLKGSASYTLKHFSIIGLVEKHNFIINNRISASA